MGSSNYVSFPRVEGRASRQAHCDLPEGTFERELGKEGFFGPATHMYHAHVPTGWVKWEGPLRPRAFDLAKLDDVAHRDDGARDHAAVRMQQRHDPHARARHGRPPRRL